MRPATDCRIVLTTISNLEDARRMASQLVERRLAACVNIAGGVRSVYRWHGAVEWADEVMLLIKTEAGKLDALEKAIKELHPYELPEVLTVAPESGSGDYLNWLHEALGE